MQNPILSLLGNKTQNNNIMGLVNMLRTGNPNEIYNQLLRSNPQFAQFVEANKGKTAEQIAQENGVDLALLKQFMK